MKEEVDNVGEGGISDGVRINGVLEGIRGGV